MLLLSRLDAGTSTLYATAAMFVMGLGLGLVMQVLVLAVQNAVDYAELGVATSGATLFRSMGGSLGTAVLGAIFTNRLTTELAGSPAAQVGSGSIDPSSVERLPAAIRDSYTSAFTDALSTVFLFAAAIVLLAFLLSWLIEERPLRQTVETAGVGEAFASPTSGDSLQELTRELARLVGRERTRAFIQRTVDAAEVDLPPGEAWLLMPDSRADRGPRGPVQRSMARRRASPETPRYAASHTLRPRRGRHHRHAAVDLPLRPRDDPRPRRGARRDRQPRADARLGPAGRGHDLARDVHHGSFIGDDPHRSRGHLAVQEPGPFGARPQSVLQLGPQLAARQSRTSSRVGCGEQDPYEADVDADRALEHARHVR